MKRVQSSDRGFPVVASSVFRAWVAGWCVCIVAAPSAADEPIAEGPGSAPIPRDRAAEARMLAAAGPGFVLHRTDHFLVCNDCDEDVVRALIWRIEATYDGVYDFCRRLGIPVAHPDRFLEVIFFDSYRGFCNFARGQGSQCTNLTGFFYTKSNQAVFYNIADDPGLTDLRTRITELERRIADRELKPGSRSRDDRPSLRADRVELIRLEGQRDAEVGRLNRLTVQHEVVHQVLYNAGVHTMGARNPGWLVEGLACLFEADQGDEADSARSVNSLRLRDLKNALGDGASSRRRSTDELLADAFRQRKLLPLVELVQDSQLFTRRDQPHLANYYAQAWSLVYFLQQHHGQQLADYIRLVSGRTLGEETTPQRELSDFESTLGPLDECFQARWADFVVGLHS